MSGKKEPTVDVVSIKDSIKEGGPSSFGKDVEAPPPFETFDVDEGQITYNVDSLQRHLGNRQIQLIAIGGSIGTALFVRFVSHRQSTTCKMLIQVNVVLAVLYTKAVQVGSYWPTFSTQCYSLSSPMAVPR